MKFTEILFSINLFLVLAFSFPTSLRGSAVISNEQNINNNNNNNNNDKEAYRILIPGGWNEIQHPDEEERVVSIAKWACNQIYPEECSNVNVISAEQQVVAGMNYRMIVNFSLKTEIEGKSACHVYDIGVYDHFGDKTLSKSHQLNVLC